MDRQRYALFFDIDGTLWDRQNRIPDSTKEAIGRLKQAGHLVFINSGRCRGYITDKELLALGFDGIVSGCATMIEYRGEVVSYYRVPGELAVFTVETLKRHGMRPILEGREYLYLDYEDFKDDPYGQKLMREMKERLRWISDCFGEWEFSKVSVDMRDADIGKCREVLGPYYEFVFHTSTVAEIVPKGYDKANCFEWAINHLGIPIENTIAFGDGMNDMGMIKAAGTGVAMGNGIEELKAAADHVTSRLDEDGILRACEHLGLI